jgi:hypothetical protein
MARWDIHAARSLNYRDMLKHIFTWVIRTDFRFLFDRNIADRSSDMGFLKILWAIIKTIYHATTNSNNTERYIEYCIVFIAVSLEILPILFTLNIDGKISEWRDLFWNAIFLGHERWKMLSSVHPDGHGCFIQKIPGFVSVGFLGRRSPVDRENPRPVGSSRLPSAILAVSPLQNPRLDRGLLVLKRRPCGIPCVDKVLKKSFCGFWPIPRNFKPFKSSHRFDSGH